MVYQPSKLIVSTYTVNIQTELKVNTYMTVYKRSMYKTACMQSISIWACTCKYTTPSLVYYVHIFDILWSFLDWYSVVYIDLRWFPLAFYGPPSILGYNNALLTPLVEFSNVFRASLCGLIWLALVLCQVFSYLLSLGHFLISSESFPALSCPVYWG